MKKLLIVLACVAICWPGQALADTPKDIATDFCQAVAAQARCSKFMVMPKDTESKLQTLAGEKLRGTGAALHPSCEAGYSKYYDAEDANGLESACKQILGLFGPDGSQRAGLVVPRKKPAMQLPESDIAAIATDLCYAHTVAQDCPTLSVADGVDARLDAVTGVNLRRKGGYFSSECTLGAFRASLAKGKTDLATFCHASLTAYGPKGSKRAGLLSGSADAPQAQSAAVAAGSAQPAPAAAKTQPAPAAAKTQPAEKYRMILTEVPPLADGATPESLYGSAPGTLSADACAQLSADLQTSQQNLASASNLGEEVQRSVHHAAKIKTAEALCPGLEAPSLPEDVVRKVAATGLEACHIALAAAKEVDKSARDFRTKKLYRALIAMSEAKLWALEAFAPSCSRLTERSMQSTIKFTKQQIERNTPNYNCRIWQDALNGAMKTAQNLGSDKVWDKAIDLLDTKSLAAVHGVSSACENPVFGENAGKRWVSRRKYMQQLMLR